MPVDFVPRPEGRVRLHAVSEAVQAFAREQRCDWKVRPGERPLGWRPVTDWLRNKVLYEWGALVGNLLLRKGLNYGIAGMYLEFENVASPGDAAGLPALERGSGGVDYYDGLAGSSTKDYLRVPLIAGTLNTSDDALFPKGNSPTFFCQTSGVVGVHGKPFSDADNSVVYGGALAAFVDAEDATQDLVFSRFYLEAAKQQAKLPTSQVGVEWELRLK